MKIKAIRTYTLDERMVAEVMKECGLKKVEGLIDLIKNLPYVNGYLDRLTVYKDNQTLMFEVDDED